MVRRGALWAMWVIAGAVNAPAALAQRPSAAIVLSETGKRATRLADEVFVSAQDLTLLQEFYSPRDTAREKRALQAMSTAMKRLDAHVNESRRQAQAGKLASAIVTFVNDESTAARSVIATQSSLHIYAKEQAKNPLTPGPHLMLITELYGKLPATPGTPEFYLEFLTWARKGFPPVRPLNAIDPALTPGEVYLRKYQQLVQPDGRDALTQKRGIDAGEGASMLRNNNLPKDLSKTKIRNEIK